MRPVASPMPLLPPVTIATLGPSLIRRKPTLYELAGITVAADGPVRLVTLNHPDQLNAFDDELHESFVQLWAAVDGDAGARAVVLTGAGRAFSAGGSFEDFER